MNVHSRVILCYIFSQVDENPEYDDIEQWQRDTEDSYFDSEPPSNQDVSNSTSATTN
jgi:hypothetical protein